MRMESRPSSDYTRTWAPSGEIECAKLADGTRLRYLRAGSGPADLILLHTVRTQLDHFQLVIPEISHAFTVYAVDMPGMGWSDITPGASYTEPALRRAIVTLADGLNRSRRPRATRVRLQHVRLLQGRRSSQSRRLDLCRRCPSSHDRASSHEHGEQSRPGHRHAGRFARRGKLPEHYLAELRRVGRRHGYPRVAREVFRNVDSMIAARALYGRVSAPVTLIYGDHDWSQIPEREANLALLRDAQSILLPDTGHFAALEQPARVAEILLDKQGTRDQP